MSTSTTQSPAGDIGLSTHTTIESPLTFALHNDREVRSDQVTDAHRALAFRKYDNRIAEVCPDRKYMPLSEDKQPAIAGNCRLDSQKARELLHTPSEATQAIKNGHTGFCLYAGRVDHGTEGLVHIDHDDTEVFPLSTIPQDTLTVRTGNGGYHEVFVNDGSVSNAKSDYGEVRAENWYCVTPGTIHSNGNVYHVCEDREIATLSSDDLPDNLLPSGSSKGGSPTNTGGSSTEEWPIDVELHSLSVIENTEYTNANGRTLSECRNDDSRLDDLLTVSFPEWNVDKNSKVIKDNSQVEGKLVNRLYNHWFTYQDIADILRYHRYDTRTEKLWKLEYAHYINRTLTECTTSVYLHGDTPEIAHIPSPDTVRGTVGDNNGYDESPVSLSKARERLNGVITDAIESGTPTLIDALCGIGKSYGTIDATAQVNIPATIFTSRHALFDQYIEWAKQHDLSVRKLPSLHEDCGTMSGEHGAVAKEQMEELYNRGFTPSDIHTYFEFPCSAGDSQCSYKSKWDFDPEEYDVLVGHYKHAYNPALSEDRAVFIDEFPGDAYETVFTQSQLSQIVTAFCEQYEGFPFTDFTNVIEQRNNPLKKEQGRVWLTRHGLGYDGESTIHSEHAHPLGSILTYGTLMAENLENGFEATSIDGYNQGFKYARKRPTKDHDGYVSLLVPPESVSNESDALICLDGTPQPQLWDLLIGCDLDHEQVLTDSERTQYLLNEDQRYIVQCSHKAVSCSSATWNNPDKSEALYRKVSEYCDSKPPLITSKKVIDQYDDLGITELVGITDHYYGNMTGSNKLGDESVGIIDGSRHFGDDYVKKWAAWNGESVERVKQNNGKDRKGMSTEFTVAIGNAALEQMRENNTAQALFRLGRDSTVDETTVYVNTAALPEWIPVASHGSIKPLSDGLHQILKHIYALNQETVTTTQVADGVTISRRKTSEHLNELSENGYLNANKNPGKATIYEITDEFTTLIKSLSQ